MKQHWRTALVAGIIAGCIAAIISFGLFYFISTLDAVTDVSFSLSFRPWWRLRNIASSIAIGAVAALLAGLRVYYHGAWKKAQDK